MRLGTNTGAAFGALWSHKLRSLLTMLGIVIGVAAVITTVAVGQGAQQRVAEQLQTLGSNLLLITPGTRRKEGVVLQAGSRLTLSLDDLRAIQYSASRVEAAGAYISGSARLVAANRNWSTLVAGVSPAYLETRRWSIAAGQPLTADHDATGAKVVVLGRTVARRLFGDADAVGRLVRIGNTPFSVIGILEEKGQTASGRDQDDVAMMPLSTARIRVLGKNNVRPLSVHGIVARVANGASLADASLEIRRILRLRHRLWPDERDDFVIRDLAQIARAQQSAVSQFTWLVGIIASVSLLVGGIGVMNTILVSVTERLRESGIRLAIGAMPRDIRVQFLIEALLLGLIGGTFGVALGIGASHAVTAVLGWRTAILPETILLAFGVSALIGLVFGLYPALKAGRVDPARILRTE